MNTEDFSFPRISGNCSCHGIDSPPLWNLSAAAASPNTYKGDYERVHCFESKIVASNKGKSGEEDQMDLLWEDFNEELTPTTIGSAVSDISSSRELVEFRCATAFTLAKKTNGALVHSNRNRHGLVLIVKVLKNLFNKKVP
ncbi:hypothetical protein PIB30_074533 [Stylosanthes scabra]|uniref:Uncharacterized protein n=1 Tax=Stylosanthes scabra TaxID=79078 RepID=A0ABU6VRJ3_9FABA|nr:hypothetical protein [Stylosanthes scabra]